MRFFFLTLITIYVPVQVKAEAINMEVKLEIVSKAKEVPLKNTSYFCDENPVSSACQNINGIKTDNSVSNFEVEDGYVEYKLKSE